MERGGRNTMLFLAYYMKREREREREREALPALVDVSRSRMK